MRGSTLILAIALLSLLALPGRASSDVVFQGGAGVCVNTPRGEHASGTTEDGQYAIVAADSGTVTIQVVGNRVGIKDDGSCAIDVAITGGEAFGVSDLSPRGSVTPLTSGSCVAGSHAPCLAEATAAWSVRGLNARASASVYAEPSVPTDVDASTDLTASPTSPPSGALGIDVTYEIGVTGASGVREVVATGSVRIWDAPASASVQGTSIP